MRFIINLFQWLRKLLTPTKAFSWQTLILLSIFSWFTSMTVTYPWTNIIASFGWIFLIFGISWFTSENPPKIASLSLGPWITGALVCIFIFGSWTSKITPGALIAWPIISVGLASIKEFMESPLKFKIPSPSVRQRIVILLGINLLISCWFQFYFVIQTWLEQYPTLITDDVRKSAFVVKLDTPANIIPRGGLMLNFLETPLKKQLDNKSWSIVEKWLFNYKKNIEKIIKQLKRDILPIEEDVWWYFKPEIKSTGSGYRLKLIAIWKGPRSQPGEYRIEKWCNINQGYRKLTTDKTPTEIELLKAQIAEVKCEPLGKIWFEDVQPIQ